MFEEQKAAIEQRFRNLLEDAVQDAVFLSSRNNELVDENQELRQRKYFVVFVFFAFFVLVYSWDSGNLS